MISEEKRAIALAFLARHRPTPGAAPDPAAEPGPLTVAGYIDYFRVNDAPWTMEERISESGRSYEKKVFLPEAYTADYMGRSDETRQLIRWGVALSDGRVVSRDGAFRVRFPDAWEAIAATAKRKRGAAREEYLALEIWRRLTPEEREAMMASVPLESYADERGITAALRDLKSDLEESGSLLHFLGFKRDLKWHARLWQCYARRYLGADFEAAFASAPWEDFLRFKLAKGGHDLPADTRPEVLALAEPNVVRGQEIGKKLCPWVAASEEYWSVVPQGQRLAERMKVWRVIRERAGEPLMRLVMLEAAPRPASRSGDRWDRQPLSSVLPSATTAEGREKLAELWREARAGMDSQWATQAGTDPAILPRILSALTTALVQYRLTNTKAASTP